MLRVFPRRVGHEGWGHYTSSLAGVGAFWKGAGAVLCRNTICNGGMVGGYKLLWLKHKQS